MPEEADLSNVLEVLEDKAFDTTIIRKQQFDIIQNVLDSGQSLDVATIERVLTVCVQELDNGKNYSSNILRIISSILKRVETGEISPLPQFTVLALAILNTIRTAAVLKKLVMLQTMCFDTFLSFPDETLLTVFSNHSTDVSQVISIYSNTYGINQESKLLVCELLIKVLKIVPLEIRTTFAKDNLTVWFAKLIPSLVTAEINGVHSPKPFEALEALAEALQTVDYSEDANWISLLQAIHDPKKYPLVMQSLLDSGHPYWHRLWIVFIKLLKNQITSNIAQGTAINSLLPVVEKAFKMDVTNRCRAFQCWDALIDNFKVEASEVYITKRLKLLIIPLQSNNAKVEETVTAKFKTWWNLIVQFQNRLDKFIDAILISFLSFGFGKKNAVSTKPAFVPGMISNSTKKLCVEAFMEIAGHLSCDGCDNVRQIPKLTRKLMTTNILVCYWNNFAYCLQKAIIIAANDSVGVRLGQVQCLWKSFVLTVGELPANNVRKDIFNELLLTLEKLTQDNDTSDNVDKNKLGSMILHLICSLFSEKHPKLDSLLKTTNDDGPLFKILTIILGPISNHLYNSNETHKCVKKLKHVTNFMMTNSSSCVPSHSVDWLLRNLSPNDNTLVLWTAMAESIYENTATDLTNFDGVLLWPLQNMNKFTDVKFAATAWYSLYSLAYKKINDSGKDQEISDMIKALEVTDMNKIFLLSTSLLIMKHKLKSDNVNNCMTELETVVAVMKEIRDYQELAKHFPMLVDNFRLLTNKITKMTSNIVIQHAITIAVKTLMVIVPSYTQHVNNTNNLSFFVKDIHNGIDEIYTHKADFNLKRKIIMELMEYLSISREYPLRHNIICMINKYLLDIRGKQSSFYSEMIKTFDSLVPNSNTNSPSKSSKSSVNQDTEKNSFMTPYSNVVTRKAKKREANIVNTVVENGEEYVVVKSNWKFNPRKLTENQKEKLQRKREDIPALYQDLSQSQDEIKLATWKTDSQDTSTTNSSKSNSKTTEETSSILKTMSSSEVIPKILENIFAENINTNKVDIAKDKPLEDSSNKMKEATPKTLKSPRIALKDRVFKNVKILIQKSQIQNDVKDSMSESLQIDNVSKTPVAEEKSAPILTNSAPPKITAERPSRVKRKPKKFDDSEIFALKKSRNSCNQNYSQLDCDQISTSPSVQNNISQETTIESENLLIEENKITEHVNIQSNVIKDSVSSNIGSSLNIQDDIERIPKDRDMIKLNDKSAISLEDDKVKCSAVEECKKIPTEDFPPVSVHVIGDNSNKDLLHDERSCVTGDKLTETPKCTKKKEGQEISLKMSNGRKSRIEKELAIDTVEGHPFLSTHVIGESSNEDLLNDERSTSCVTDDKLTETPKCAKKKEGQEISLKMSNGRKSRIEKELAIDTVEGHPFLSTHVIGESSNEDLLHDERSCVTGDKLTETPKCTKKKEGQEISLKMSNGRKSRIEKELAIDTVEGHPFLSTHVIGESSNEDLLNDERSTSCVTDDKLTETPKCAKRKEDQDNLLKMSTGKKSRIEKELAIDTVKGHPFLSTRVSDESTNEELLNDERSTPCGTGDKLTETPKCAKKKDDQENSSKISTGRKSRIEKELAIDTVEGHPFLSTRVSAESTNEELLIDERSTSSVTGDKLAETPKCAKKKEGQENTLKNSTGRKSRIEKELAIDTVEGHPFLKAQKEKRLTRKQLNDASNSTRRKSLTEKLNKLELKSAIKLDKKGKEKEKQRLDFISPIVTEFKEGQRSDSVEDLPCSEDIIESSQDSTVTTISVKSVKPILKTVSVVIENMRLNDKVARCPLNTQNLIQTSDIDKISLSSNQDSKDDIEFPRNKTAIDEQKGEDLTENMDTEPIDLNIVNNIISHDSIAIDTQKDQDCTENIDTEPFNHYNSNEVLSQNTTDIDLLRKDKDLTENMDTQSIGDTINIDDVIVVNDDEQLPTTVNSESSLVGPETQELAEADTEPTNFDCFVNHKVDIMIENKNDKNAAVHNAVEKTDVDTTVVDKDLVVNSSLNKSQDEDITQVIDTSGGNEQDHGSSSPFKDEAQRKKDFLDNTFEISPIKTMSPAKDKKSPSPESSSDFVVIKLSSPVHSNGEPFEKCDSPEIFTEDKVSPDKRDLSPPREPISVINNTSPNSSMSLKKNRPQVRSTGRAAQMLGLCVPKGIQTIMNSERCDVEEPKKCNTSNILNRKPLRVVYCISDNVENSEENEESEKFLKFQRSLPTADCSPSGPILKRKLAEITDEATVSPASKRKRVSFHDPPVSTTVSVQKYIEPGVIRSPQNSAAKRQERQLRYHTNMKSAKKLDVSCKLDTVLNIAVGSFSDNVQNLSTEDTQVTSLDETPIVEVVKTSDLNDRDPICPELIDCDESIDVIATELSSPAMKMMFLKELEGSIMTVGDLAKMTELEVNRLCIKAPKVKVARKVLTDYMAKRAAQLLEKQNDKCVVEEIEIETVTENKTIDVEVQTHIELKETDMQTDIKEFKLSETQTDNVMLKHCHVQTKESASDSTADVINTCLAERPDFVEKLSDNLEDASLQQIADRLSFDALSSCLIKKVTDANTHMILNQVLEKTGNDRLSFLQKYLYDSMEPRDLTLLCVRLLNMIHDKPA